MRTDILYKTIIRDLRRYYMSDFNNVTSYITKKRYKSKNYFFICIRRYLLKRFPEIIKHDLSDKNELIPKEDLNDFVFFMSCFLYPKEIPS